MYRITYYDILLIPARKTLMKCHCIYYMLFSLPEEGGTKIRKCNLNSSCPVTNANSVTKRQSAGRSRIFFSYVANIFLRINTTRLDFPPEIIKRNVLNVKMLAYTILKNDEVLHFYLYKLITVPELSGNVYIGWNCHSLC